MRSFYIFLKTDIIKNTASLIGATSIAQLIGILILPLLSRIYAPKDFGILGVYLSVVSILVMFTGLRYYLAIPLPKFKKYALALLYISLISHIIYTILLFVLATIYGVELLHIFRLDSLTEYIYLIPIGILTTGLYTIMSQWAIREGYFDTVSRTRILQSTTGNSTKLVLGYYGIKPEGLILGTIIAQSGGNISIIKRALKENTFHLVPIQDIQRTMLRYRHLPIYDMWTAIINVIGFHMPQLFLAYYYTLDAVGLYSMAVSLLSLPISLIGGAIGQVFIQKMAQAKYNGSLKSFCVKSYETMLWLSIFPIGLVSILAPTSLSYFLGEHWARSGYYALALFPKMAYSFTYTPMCMLYYAISNKIKMSFFHEILLTIIMAAGLLTGRFCGSPLGSITVYSIFSLCMMIWRMCYILKAITFNYQVTINITFNIFLRSFLFLLIPIITILNTRNIFLNGSAITTSLMMYLYWLMKFLRQ